MFSVISVEEQQFLQSYRCLRQWPEFFMLKEMFSAMDNNLAKEEAVKMLQSFEIENNEIRCTDGNALQVLITYVKRLLQLFPEIKESTKVLERSVHVQGAKICLYEIMDAESAVANFLSLGALLGENELKIADPLPTYNAYNTSCYIERTFRRKIAINLDIYTHRYEQIYGDFLAGSEQEFQQICQQYPKRNVHWLVTEKSGKLVWQQSRGSLETLSRYIDTGSSHRYTADDLEKLLGQAEHQRVTLISDKSGMGKSTLLTHLSKQIKQKFPTKCVVKIDLNDHTDALNALKQEQIDKEKAIEFVSEKLLKLKLGLEMELFKECYE